MPGSRPNRPYDEDPIERWFRRTRENFVLYLVIVVIMFVVSLLKGGDAWIILFLILLGLPVLPAIAAAVLGVLAAAKGLSHYTEATEEPNPFVPQSKSVDEPEHNGEPEPDAD